MKVGELVKLWSGEYGTIVRGPYTFRDISSQMDRDLINHGMGHMAGSYTSAIDIVNHQTGETTRHSLSSNSFEVISESR